MAPDLSFFHRGDNPLLDFSLRHGLDTATLAPLMIVLSMLLGYAAFTDFFRGWIIPDWVNGAVGMICVSAAPLIYADPLGHLKTAAIVAVVILIVGLVAPVFAMGDTKLYVALALGFGTGVFALMLFSWLLVLVYAWYHLAQKYVGVWQARKRGETVKRAPTPAPLGPAIAMAFPVTLYMSGMQLREAAGLFAVELAALGMCVVYRCFEPRIAQINEDAELLALSQAYLEAMPTDIADQLRPYASGKAVDAASKPPVDSEMLTHTSQPSDGEQVDAPRPERAPRFKAA